MGPMSKPIEYISMLEFLVGLGSKSCNLKNNSEHIPLQRLIHFNMMPDTSLLKLLTIFANTDEAYKVYKQYHEGQQYVQYPEYYKITETHVLETNYRIFFANSLVHKLIMFI